MITPATLLSVSPPCSTGFTGLIADEHMLGAYKSLPYLAKDILNVNLSPAFLMQEPIYYSIISPSGQKIKEAILVKNIDISKLDNGIHF